MIQVYGSPQSRAFRTLWMLDELGLEYQNVEVDTQAGENRRPEFLALNPNGRVPTLVDGDIVVWAPLLEFDVSGFPRVCSWLDACLAGAKESLKSKVVAYWAAARQTDGPTGSVATGTATGSR